MDKWEKNADEKEGRKYLYGIQTKPQITWTKIVYFVCLLVLNTFSFPMSISRLHSKGSNVKIHECERVPFLAKQLPQ